MIKYTLIYLHCLPFLRRDLHMKIKDNNFDGILDILIKTPFSMNTDKALHFKHKLNLFCNYSKTYFIIKVTYRYISFIEE